MDSIRTKNIMAGSFTQIYIQIVFAVRNRKCLIDEKWEVDLYKFITGIIQNKGQKLIAINGMPDHIHIFIGMKPTCCLSDLIREIKKSSNTYINSRRLSYTTFKWQSGFGAFSYNHSQISTIANYIENQKEHHAKQTFKKEYVNLLLSHQIEHRSEYLFDWIDVRPL